MTSNLYGYKFAGIGQHYFPDETVDEPGPNYELPYNLRTRWVKRAVQVENRSGKLANFSHFSEFVQQESEEANSLFGLRSLNVKPSISKVKAASYTTTSFNSSDLGLKPQNC